MGTRGTTKKIYVDPPRYFYKGHILFVQEHKSVWAVWFEGVNGVLVKMVKKDALKPTYTTQEEAQTALDSFAKSEKLERCYKIVRVKE